jgi:D-alanine-D-alanine ligase
MKITVLLGGSSEERAVSLSSGAAVAGALREAGHQVIAWDTLTGWMWPEAESRILEEGIPPEPPDQAESDLIDSGNLAPMLTSPEVAGTDLFFPVLHGGAGEDGRLQTLLELAGVPFVGSGRVGCMLAMDKDLSKRLLRDEGIPSPHWFVADGADALGSSNAAAELEARAARELGYPLIVKPPSGGSTVGLTLVHDERELPGAVRRALELEPRVMFERFVKGRELTVPVVGEEPLPVGEIIPEHEIFDYECKYQPGMAQEIFPARIPAPVAEAVQELALRVHELLRLDDFSRVDFILDPEGAAWVLEANTLPGMSPSSLVPKSGRAAGLSFPALCDRIVQHAIARTGRGGGGPS